MKLENHIYQALKSPNSIDLISIGLKTDENEGDGRHHWFPDLEARLSGLEGVDISTYNISADDSSSAIHGNVFDADFSAYDFLDGEMSLMAAKNVTGFTDRNPENMGDDPVKNYVKMADRTLYGLDAVLFVDIEDDLESHWNYNEHDFEDVTRMLKSDTRSKAFMYPMDTGDDYWLLYRRE